MIWQSAFLKHPTLPPPLPCIAQELSRAELWDTRRTERLVQITQALEANPSFSIPQACGGEEADIAATYRFLNNSDVYPDDILLPHFQASSERIAGYDRILIAHDTTDCVYKHKGESATRIRLETVSQHTEMFHAHASLAMTADGQRIPLGLIAWETWSRHHNAPLIWSEEKESIRWFTQMKAAQSFVPEGTLAVHLADRGISLSLSLLQAVNN